MKNKLWLYGILLISFFCLVKTIPAQAEESSNLGYTVSAVLTSKQIDKEKSYFYLQTNPAEEQEIEVKVKSTQKEPVKVAVYTTNAFTDSNGTIEYSVPTEGKNMLISDPVTSLVKVENPSITVGNFEEKTAKFKITPPKESYEGVKMGALVFELDDGESDEQVSSKFAYRIGFIISETGDEFKNGAELNLTGVKSSLKGGKKMVLATLQNPEPKVLSNLSITTEIKAKDSSEVVNKKKVNSYMMAPNSQFDFEIDFGRDTVKAGTYILTMAANNEFKDWSFTKEFTISASQAKEMNENTVFKVVTPTWIKGVTIGEFILLIGAMIFQIVRRKKMESIWQKKRRNKKRKKQKVGN